MKGSYSDLWKAIIRPDRDLYDPKDLGPKKFAIGNNLYERSDLELVNERSQKLQCSHFQPVPSERVAAQLPCVIYLHGNSSSRVEALSCVPILLPINITVFAIDLSGSGHSDGDYISLGYWEREDLKCVIDYLRQSGAVTTIGLWGRSMGAVTSLLHGDRDPSIAGMVLDSPFSSLRLLCDELVKKHSKLPKFLIAGVVKLVRRSIKKKAQFNIDDLNPLMHVDKCFIPAFFVVAKDDDFILPHHGEDLHEVYAGDKNLIKVEGDHNSERPEYLNTSISIFFFNTLQCALLPEHIPKPVRKKTDSKPMKIGHMIKPRENVIKNLGFYEVDEDELVRKAIEESLITDQKEKEQREGKEDRGQEILKYNEELKEVNKNMNNIIKLGEEEKEGLTKEQKYALDKAKSHIKHKPMSGSGKVNSKADKNYEYLDEDEFDDGDESDPFPEEDQL